MSEPEISGYELVWLEHPLLRREGSQTYGLMRSRTDKIIAEEVAAKLDVPVDQILVEQSQTDSARRAVYRKITP